MLLNTRPVEENYENIFGVMLTYSVLVTFYLAFLGIEGERAKSLLWPTVVLHAILTILPVCAWQKEQRA